MAEIFNEQRVLGVRVLGDGSGGGGAQQVEVSNAQDIAPGVGGLNAQPYSDDTGAGDGSVIGLLKGIYVQNVQIIALLTQIETNTNTGGA